MKHEHETLCVFLTKHEHEIGGLGLVKPDFAVTILG